MQAITHPVSGAAIEGSRLAPGSKIRKDDQYDSTDGKWRPAGWVAGNILQPGCTTIWVRHAPMSDNACTLLDYLNTRPWGARTCIGERNGSFFAIPSPTFNWDGRFDIEAKRVVHPECVQELVDYGYLELGEHDIARSTSDYAMCQLFGSNRAYTLTEKGKRGHG